MDFKQSKDRLWLVLLFATALVVRIIVLAELSRHNPAFLSPDVDSLWHYLWAKSLAKGHWLGESVFYRAPLYPYTLGFWITVFGDNLWLIRIAQAVLSAFSAVMVGLIGWRAFGRSVGVIAGCAWALWGPVVYYDSELLVEVLFVPLTLLAIWLALGRFKSDSGRVWPWLGIGGILGLAAITRPNILITLPAFWWMAWQHSSLRHAEKREIIRTLRRPLAITLGMLLPILPVTARNLFVGHDSVMIAYQGGVNLYIGNNPVADGLTMQMPEVMLDPTLPWDRFVFTTDSIAMAEEGRSLRPSEISSHWTGKAWEYIRAHPRATITSWFAKAYYLFNGFEVGDQTSIYDFTRYSLLLRALIWRKLLYFPFGLIAPLALLGIWWSWSRSHTAGPLTAFVALYSLSVVGFLATARHRLPMVPLMVVFAAVAVLYGWKQIRNRRWKFVSIYGGVALLLTVWLNRPTVDRIMRNPSFTAYQEGLAYDRLGNYDQARQKYEEVIREEPFHLAARRNLALDLVKTRMYDSAIAVSYSYLRIRQTDAEAMNNLGLAYLGKGDTSRALGAFTITARTNPKMGQPHFNTADIALAQGDTATAVSSYHRAIAADSTFGAAYNSLGILYAGRHQFDSATAVLERCTRINPDYLLAWINSGGVLLESGRPIDAIAPLSKALELDSKSSPLRFNLAVAYLRSGNQPEASRQLRELLSSDPNNTAARQLLSTLENPKTGPP